MTEDESAEYVLGIVLVIVIILVALAGLTAGSAGPTDEQTGEPDGSTEVSDDELEDIPDDVRSSQPLAMAVYENVTTLSAYDSARVFIGDDGALLLTYQTTATSGDELQQEVLLLTDEYATIVDSTGYTAKTLTVVVGEVRAIVPAPTVRAYVDGDIKRTAFFETVQFSNATSA